MATIPATRSRSTGAGPGSCSIRLRCGVRPTPRRATSCGTTSGCPTWRRWTGTPCLTNTGRCSTGSPPGPSSSTCSGRFSASSAPRMPTPARRMAARHPPRRARPGCPAPSHADAPPPDGATPSAEQAAPGLLGADMERSGDAWRLTRVVRGDTSDPRARAPLAAPGAGVSAGDVLLAVDGRPVGPEGPGPLRAGAAGRGGREGPGPLRTAAAGKPVELTVAPADGSGPRSVPVVPLRSDSRLRYLDWVGRKRAQVRELG